MEELFWRGAESVAGAIGGLAAGSLLKGRDFGKLGDTITGLIGGLLGAYLLSATFSGLADAANSGSILGRAGMIIGAFVCGAVLLGICSLAKDMLSPKSWN
jgi:uncharacterized membrane protein YeaQ/YmgE (transglycosylase-associated protein family)